MSVFPQNLGSTSLSFSPQPNGRGKSKRIFQRLLDRKTEAQAMTTFHSSPHFLLSSPFKLPNCLSLPSHEPLIMYIMRGGKRGISSFAAWQAFHGWYSTQDLNLTPLLFLGLPWSRGISSDSVVKYQNKEPIVWSCECIRALGTQINREKWGMCATFPEKFLGWYAWIEPRSPESQWPGRLKEKEAWTQRSLFQPQGPHSSFSWPY